MAIRILQLIGLIAGLITLTLGILDWFTSIEVVNFHMLFGFIISIMLLTLGIIGICTRGMRILGLVGTIYALLVPVFGMTQFEILVGDLHWIIQVAHMLVGLGAMALVRTIGERIIQSKQQKTSVQEVAA